MEEPVSTKELESYFDRLWPLLRSLTGEGVRNTLEILDEIVPLDRMRFPSGQEVFDWTIPQEWVVNEAYLVTPGGKKILDVRDHNLHLVNYSNPYIGEVSRKELEEHLYSLPDQEQAIPYVTAYYTDEWGFCLSHKRRQQLPEGRYEVHIDTEFKQGELVLGEAVLPGKLDREILFSTYICHPSMANNELSGPLTAAYLYQNIAEMDDRKFTYRFVFAPETIGTLAYLTERGSHFKEHLHAGYVITCTGDPGCFTYKKTRQGNAITDRVAEYTLKQNDEEHAIEPFRPLGSDERQYCSPGFNLPVGSLMRSKYNTFPEYHTSLDNKEFISFNALKTSIQMYFSLVKNFEMNGVLERTNPYGEPKLDQHDLYPPVNHREADIDKEPILWLMNYADGEHDLISIAEMSGFDLEILYELAQNSVSAGLIEEKQSYGESIND